MSIFETYQREIAEVCKKVRETRSMTKVIASDGAEIYGYPRARDRVAWSVNAADGFNILRGIRLPDGSDIAVH